MKHIGHSFIALLIALFAAHAQASDLATAFTSPTNGAVFPSPEYLTVTATESSNTIVSAEFFANGQSIGVVGNYVFPVTPSNPPGSIGITITEIFIVAHPDSLPDNRSYLLLWHPQPGDYTLTVQATDNHGNTAVSDPVNVTVIPTPYVSVQASVSLASANGPGIFTITRNGDTNDDLNVPFFLLGNAQNGVDYTQVTNSVTIPAGQFSADVAINPLVYHQGNTRAVSLQLYNYLIPGSGSSPGFPVLGIDPPFPVPYLVGLPGAATIYIKANERDAHRPVVRITLPWRGQTFAAGSDFTLEAKTFDLDTDVSSVEFFDRTTKLGEIPAMTTTLPGQHIPFYFIWTNARPGGHVLRARATDSQGKTQISRPVRIQVAAP